MRVTQKKQYALRAIFELSKRRGQGPVKSSEIAEAQAIPTRFLEVILSQLKRGGIVNSKRGFYGGYTLNCSPSEITVGDLFRLLDQAEIPAECSACISKQDCPFQGSCVFMPMWNRVKDAMDSIYDKTTIQDLIDEERQLKDIPKTGND